MSPNPNFPSVILLKQSLLTWLVGNDQDQAGELKLQWTNFPESWGVFVLLGVLAAVVFAVFAMYRREINTCPPAVKMLMATMRLVVLLFLIVLFLKPSIFFQQITEIKPGIALLRDASLSLDRGDKYRDEKQVQRLSELTGYSSQEIASAQRSRVDLVGRALAKHPEIVQQIRTKGSLRIFDFSDTSETVTVLPALSAQTESAQDTPSSPATDSDSGLENEAVDPTNIDPDAEGNNNPRLVGRLPELVADGFGTNIWRALEVALEDSSRISSIVVLSEGQHNSPEDPTELAEKAASFGIPIITIGIGDPNPPRNVKISEIYVRSKAYPDEPFEIESVLQTSRRNATKLPPQLTVSLSKQMVDPSSGGVGDAQVVATREVDVPEDGGRIRVDFDHINQRPGRYVYTVAVQELDNETNLDDNQLMSSELEVVDEKVKVLLVAGLPNWDFQQVQRLLLRDQTIDLTCWLQSMDESRPQEGNEPIGQLPRTMEELGKYNVVIMMDPNPAEFDDQWAQLLKDFCKYKAGGVLFMTGPHFSSEFLTLNRLAGFRDLLPVKFGDNEFIDRSVVLASATGDDAGSMLVVNHNLDHPVMSFKADVQQSAEIWGLMPGVSWTFPTKEAKATARVLLERGDQVNGEGNQPLLVSGRYGAGSVLFFGFQGTWKWRPLGLQAQYFDRFWIQVVRFLVETRSLQGSRRGFLDREKSEYELGQRITLVARVLDTQFRPLTEPTVSAIVTAEDGREETVELKLLPQQQGRYEGSMEARRPGNYTATIDLGQSDSQSAGAETSEGDLIDPISFRITTPSAETGAYWLNEPLLAAIAEKSGGAYLPLDQIERLPELIPTKITRAEFNSPPRPLWDASQLLRWLAFALPAILLSAEWALRKYYKLL